MPRKNPVEVETELLSAEENEVSAEGALEQFLKDLAQFAKDKAVTIQLVQDQGQHFSYSGKDYGDAKLHSKIKIEEDHPKINFNHRKAYQNIFNKFTRT